MLKTLRNKYVLFFLVILIYLAARLPFYCSPLRGEDGCFAAIFLNHPPNPNYVQRARVNGVEIYGPPEHPALMYEILSLYGKIWGLVFKLDKLPDLALAIILRFAFSLFQLSIFLLAVSLIMAGSKGWFLGGADLGLLIGTTIAFISPIAIKTSISLQVDGTIGVLTAGLFALTLWLYDCKDSLSLPVCASVFFCSLLYGLGKNEWSFALAMAVFLAGIYLTVVKAIHRKRDFRLILFISLGLLIGNAISYLYDLFNYLHGIDMLIRINKASGPIDPQKLIFLMRTRSPSVITIIVMLIINALALPRAWRGGKTASIILFFLGSLLFFGFLLCPWAKRPRYYAPSFVVLLIGAIVSYRLNSGKLQLALTIGCCCFILFHSAFYLRPNVSRIRPYKELVLYGVSSAETAEIMPSIDKAAGCLPIMGVGEAFNKKIDYVSNSLSREDAEFIADKYGKKLCPIMDRE